MVVKQYYYIKPNNNYVFYVGIIIWNDNEIIMPPTTPSALSPHIRAIVLFLLLWQCYFCISDTGMGVLFVFVYHLLKMCKDLLGEESFETFPKNLSSARKMILDESAFLSRKNSSRVQRFKVHALPQEIISLIN